MPGPKLFPFLQANITLAGSFPTTDSDPMSFITSNYCPSCWSLSVRFLCICCLSCPSPPRAVFPMKVLYFILSSIPLPDPSHLSGPLNVPALYYPNRF